LTRHLNAAEIQKRIEICRDKAADTDLSTRCLAARHHTSLRVVASALSLPIKDWKELLADLQDDKARTSKSRRATRPSARVDGPLRPAQAMRSASGFPVVPVARRQPDWHQSAGVEPNDDADWDE
jgi:hypothetical protein